MERAHWVGKSAVCIACLLGTWRIYYANTYSHYYYTLLCHRLTSPPTCCAYDDEGEHGQIRADDAAADGLALAGTLSALTEALHALLEEKAHTLLGEDTLKHGETLLVVTAGDTEDVSLELIAEGVAGDLTQNRTRHGLSRDSHKSEPSPSATDTHAAPDPTGFVHREDGVSNYNGWATNVK